MNDDCKMWKSVDFSTCSIPVVSMELQTAVDGEWGADAEELCWMLNVGCWMDTQYIERTGNSNGVEYQ